MERPVAYAVAEEHERLGGTRVVRRAAAEAFAVAVLLEDVEREGAVELADEGADHADILVLPVESRIVVLDLFLKGFVFAELPCR